jgi:hypothetical protein
VLGVNQSQKNKDKSRIIVRIKHMRKRKGGLIPYGPDDTTVTKLVASILDLKTGSAMDLKKWISSDGSDLRRNSKVMAEIVEYFNANKISETIIMPKILGCPHEEGIDYPEGQPCPQCPFWNGKDRWN